MFQTAHHELVVKHLIEMPSSQCVFCSTVEKDTGRTQLFLIFQHQQKIYKRNGLRGTWHEMTDREEYLMVRELFQQSQRQQKVPCYSTAA
jgi:hypothetical protein